MRVAFVSMDPGVPVFGSKGCSIHCQEIIREFRSRGWHVDLFATSIGGALPSDFRGLGIHRLTDQLPADSAAREQAIIALNDVVHQRLSDCAPFDLVYERYALWSFAAMKFAHEKGVPGVLEVNAPLIEEQKTYRLLVDERNARQISESCFEFASSIIAVSDSVALQVATNDDTRHKLTVVENGVNCHRFRVALRPNRDSTVVGFVGTLKPWHGVANLLSAYSIAFRQNSNLRLFIVGAGPEERSLRQQLSSYPERLIDSVQFLGAVSGDEVPQILAGIDIAVAPYPDLEQFYFSPLKILEYMASGKAIIASRIGQIPQLLSDESGILVDPGSTQELASAILQLAADEQLRKTLGRSAESKANSEHSWKAVVDRILETVPGLHLQCEAN